MLMAITFSGILVVSILTWLCILQVYFGIIFCKLKYVVDFRIVFVIISQQTKINKGFIRFLGSKVTYKYGTF